MYNGKMFTKEHDWSLEATIQPCLLPANKGRGSVV